MPNHSAYKYCDNLVSIVTPAWKAADTINDTINSVLSQTYSDWEMLIVDDCSPDNTVSLVDAASQEDHRIKLIRQPKNSGPANARNTALCLARGRWIAFLDSDDLWLPSKLESQLAFHQAQGACISYTGYRRISADGNNTGRLIKIPERLTYSELLSNTAITTSTVIVDRNKTGDFAMKSIYYDDFGCWLELLRGDGFAAGLNDDLARYRMLEGSVSRNKWRSALEVWKTYRKVESLGFFRSAWHFSNYIINALAKYRYY